MNWSCGSLRSLCGFGAAEDNVNSGCASEDNFAMVLEVTLSTIGVMFELFSTRLSVELLQKFAQSMANNSRI